MSLDPAWGQQSYLVTAGPVKQFDICACARAAKCAAVIVQCLQRWQVLFQTLTLAVSQKLDAIYEGSVRLIYTDSTRERKKQSIFCQSPIQISEAKTPLWKLQENSLIFDPKSVWYNSNTHYFIWPSALAITFETTTPIDVLSHFVFCDCSYLFYCFLLLAGFCLDFGGPCGWPIAQKCLAINCQKVPKFKAERRQNIGKIPKKYDNGMTNLNDLTTFVQCRNTERKERISRHLCVCCLYL